MEVEKINRSKIYTEKMRQEGNVITYNKSEDIKVSIKMNENLERFRKEYQVRDRNSQMSAYKVVLSE